MKKTGMSLLTAAVCMALSVSAFALPAFGNASFQAVQGEVREKETPREYMEDFNAQAKGENEGKIFLMENQIRQVVAAAEQAFREKLGMELPEGLEFEYDAYKLQIPEDENVYINLVWLGSEVSPVTGQRLAAYHARFENADFPNKPATLRSVHANMEFDGKRLEHFEKEGRAAVKKELDMTVPEDYMARVSLSASFESGQENTSIQFNWCDRELDARSINGEDITAFFYNAFFDNVDLTKNTGRLTGVQKFYEFTQQTIKKYEASPGYIPYTDAQQKEMLDKAKQFLADKNIETGNLYRALQINVNGESALWLNFEAVGLNDTANGVTITITPGLKVLGYTF